MAKKINYASLFTLRKDGRYQGSYTDAKGRHYVYDKDPEKLWHKLNERMTVKPVKFEDLADEWHTDYVQQAAYKTEESSRAPLSRLLGRFGDEVAEDITAMQITAYLAELGRKGYSRRTVQLHKNIMSMIFNKGLATGQIKVSPMNGVIMPRNLAETRRELPPDDALEAIKKNTDIPFALFALLCLYAGLRRGEALALKYEDIDRVNKTIRVERAIEFVGNDPHIKSPKTNAGKRKAVLLDALAAHIPEKGKGYIFVNDEGGLLTKMQYRKRWERYCKAIGHELTAHQLRHGFATILYEAGVPDKDAQELLGHTSITLTRDIYTHIRQSRRDDVISKLNDFVST